MNVVSLRINSIRTIFPVSYRSVNNEWVLSEPSAWLFYVTIGLVTRNSAESQQVYSNDLFIELSCPL
jgi:hypothetical protein